MNDKQVPARRDVPSDTKLEVKEYIKAGGGIVIDMWSKHQETERHKSNNTKDIEIHRIDATNKAFFGILTVFALILIAVIVGSILKPEHLLTLIVSASTLIGGFFAGVGLGGHLKK